MSRIPLTSGQQAQVPAVQQTQTMDPKVQQLFQPKPQTQLSTQFIAKGSLITFAYTYWKHDPYPVVIITDTIPGERIRGVNINYLTFNVIKGLLNENCNNAGFSYTTFRSNQYITKAFRTYKWNGVRQVKKLDCDFLLTVMAMVRSFDPAEVEIIRKLVHEQMQQQINPTAAQIQGEAPAPSGQVLSTPTAPTTPVIEPNPGI